MPALQRLLDIIPHWLAASRQEGCQVIFGLENSHWPKSRERVSKDLILEGLQIVKTGESARQQTVREGLPTSEGAPYVRWRSGLCISQLLFFRLLEIYRIVLSVLISPLTIRCLDQSLNQYNVIRASASLQCVLIINSYYYNRYELEITDQQ